MTRDLRTREPDLRELMDDPHCDPHRLRRTLRRFGLVNALVSYWGAVYRAHLRPELARLNRPASILDIGCGAGDVLRSLVRRAHRDGFELSGLGIDPDPRALAASARSRRTPGVDIRRATSRDLVAESARFDFVISNHVLHHLGDEQLAEVLADSAVLASRLALHSDIARSQAAYFAFSVGVIPFAPGSFLRVDGLRSIRRSFTPDELAARLPPGWRVERPGAFRLLAVRDLA